MNKKKDDKTRKVKKNNTGGRQTVKESDSALNIQWYPGHMTKTRRMIEEDIKIIDAVVEIADARCPEASRNPILDDLIKDKPRVLLLNKCDYADEKQTAIWSAFYEKKGLTVLQCDCRSGKGVQAFAPMLKKRLSNVLERRRERGTSGKSLRVMVVGIPNVGKSSFINRMAGARKTKVGDTPGVTRGKQWVVLDSDIELLDMPGILWHKFDDKNSAMMLAYTGAVKDKVMDTEGLAYNLGNFLIKEYPENIKERYNIDIENVNVDGLETGLNILERIAKNRGMLASGGIPDTERAAAALLDDYRGGKLGRITLEKPIS